MEPNIEDNRTAVSLSLKYLPTHHFVERHELTIAANPDVILDAAARIEPGDDRLIGGFLSLRQLPHRLLGKQAGAIAAFGRKTFTLLERNSRGIAYGLVGRFWRLDFGLEPVNDGQAFLAFNEPGVAKLVMAFDAQPLSFGDTMLVTTTRIYCPDRATRLRMLPYWTAIRPVSGLIRRRTLRLVKRAAEASAPVPVS